MIYLYAICAIPAPDLDDVRGVGQAPVATVAADGLTAICSRVDELPETVPAALLDHERVVEAAMACATILPVRFGTTQPDGAAVRDLLARRRTAFATALDAVEGCVEFSVRARWPAAVSTVVDGRAYLRDRMAARDRGDAVHERLAVHAQSSTRRLTPGGLTAAYLVPRDALPGFTSTLRDVDLDPVDLSCTGPWPPYSFVGSE